MPTISRTTVEAYIGAGAHGAADGPPGNSLTQVLANSMTDPLGNCVTCDTLLTRA